MVNVVTMLPLKWPLEKVRWQNPRIRALLGSVRSLDGVLESDFAILHCSPTRLLEIWDTVRTVCWVVQTKVTRLMEHPSMLPDLDEAVRNARETLTFLDGEVFAHLDRFPDRPEEHQFDELRKTLCITIGKLHGFLVDTLGKPTRGATTTSTTFSPASSPAMWRSRSGCKPPWVGSKANSYS